MPTIKYCPYPFSRIQLNGMHAFIPCCSFWLKDKYYQIEVGEDPWNGAQAQELRSKILQGDYTFCKRELCHVPLMDLTEMRQHANKIFNETPLTTPIIDAIEKKQTIMPSGPPSISIGGDRRCNLSCPTCRDKRITTLNNYQVRNINYIQNMIEHFYRQDMSAIKISAEGEPFYSPWFRELLKNCHTGNFPKMKFINLLSNGTLFTPSNWNLLKPGIKNVKEVSISVDAGNAETYQKVRGFSWKKLIDNLRFISHLRKENNIQTFRLLFVVRKSNYQSMEDFIHLGKSLKADVVHFSPLSKWPDTTINYEDEAIFLPSHRNFEQLKKICLQIRSMNEPIVRLDIPNISDRS